MTANNPAPPSFSFTPPRLTHRLRIISILGLLLLLCCCSNSPDNQPQKSATGKAARQNIIFLLVDTLRADYLGAYGFPANISPHFDKLAEESVLFERAVSAATWTKPSIASIFTSLSPLTHRTTDTVWVENTVKNKERFKPISFEGKTYPIEDLIPKIGVRKLADQHVTMAERLKASGYNTMSIVGGNTWVSEEFGLTQGFNYAAVLHDKGCPFHNCKMPANQVNKMAIRLLEHHDQHFPASPYFLYLHYMDVHFPYVCTPGDFAELRQAPNLQQKRRISDELWERLPEHQKQWVSSWKFEAARRQLLNWKICYASGIKRFDQYLGDLIARLKASGRLDDTVLVFTSDHGEEFLEHGMWEHGKTLYRELTHIPLLVRFPDLSGAGKRVKNVVSSLDLMPSLLTLAEDNDQPGAMQGRNLAPLFSGDKDNWPDVAFSSGLEYYPFRIAMETATHQLISDIPTGLSLDPINTSPEFQWEALKDKDALLFNVIRDTESKSNLYMREAQLKNELKERMQAHFQAVKPDYSRPLADELQAISADSSEQLKALGYLQ